MSVRNIHTKPSPAPVKSRPTLLRRTFLATLAAAGGALVVGLTLRGRLHRPSTSALTAARELRAMMQGRVVLRGDDDYARTRQIFNRAVGNQPAIFAVCETSADVQAGVRVARRHGLPLSVRGGGHHWAGLSLSPDGLVMISAG